MKAARLTAYQRPLVIEECDRPEPGPGELLLKVEASGVCHSDLHIAEGEWDYFKAFIKLPVTLGHEIVGKVVATGAEVSEVRVGDRVGVPWIYSSCNTCEYCLNGCETMCSRQVITGAMVDGGYAEYCKAKVSHATMIPSSLSSEQAAPFLCAGVTVYKGLNRADIHSGQRVGIFGIGGLGHLAVQLARRLGAKVYAVDTSDLKTDFAKECGAQFAINASKDDVAGRLQRERGLDIAVVTSGSLAAYETAFLSLRRGGTLVVLGIPRENLSLSPLRLVATEATIIASAVGSRGEIRELLQLAVDGEVRCYTHTEELESINTVFNQMKRGELIGKAVLTF